MSPEFANGAVTAAFAFALNQASDKKRVRHLTAEERRKIILDLDAGERLGPAARRFSSMTVDEIAEIAPLWKRYIDRGFYSAFRDNAVRLMNLDGDRLGYPRFFAEEALDMAAGGLVSKAGRNAVEEFILDNAAGEVANLPALHPAVNEDWVIKFYATQVTPLKYFRDN